MKSRPLPEINEYQPTYVVYVHVCGAKTAVLGGYTRGRRPWIPLDTQCSICGGIGAWEPFHTVPEPD